MTIVPDEASSSTDRRTILFCFLAALVEGYDIQSAGVVAPLFRPAFDFTVGQMGWVFSGNTFGLFVGAAVGGWFADRIGRKWLLVGAMIAFGVFTLASAWAQTGNVFIATRILTGMGLGAALPNLIALTAEAGGPNGRATRVTLITAGMPLGGAIAGAIMLLVPDIGWRTIFALGGWVPLVIGVMMISMRESSAFTAARAHGRRGGGGDAGLAGERTGLGALFGPGRAMTTVLLWVSFSFTLVVLYLLLNWLPSLLRSRGFSAPEATFAAFLFSLGGGVGAVVLGALMLVWSRSRTIGLAYAGMIASAIGLAALSDSPALTYVAAASAGCFVIGCQFVLYGLSPTFYAAPVRGTGVGAAVAAGRLGAIVGPAAAAVMLGAGRSVTEVLAALIPVILIAAVCAYALSLRPVSDDSSA